MTGPSATPAPSWPVASQSPGTARDAPIAGRWSGSHGRSPAHAAATGSAATRGNSRAARAIIASLTAASTDVSKPRRSRDEPTSTSPSHVVSTTVLTSSPLPDERTERR